MRAAYLLSLLLLLAPRATAQPQDVQIKAELSVVYPVLAKGGMVLGLGYAAYTSLTQLEIRQLFPSQYNGDAPQEWGIRSREGIVASLEPARSWSSVMLSTDPEVLEPIGLAALAQGGPPVLLGGFRYREDDSVPRQLSCTTSYFCTFYDFGSILLFAPDSSPDPAWEAAVSVEFYCKYGHFNGDGLVVVGELTSSDLGLPTDTATVSGDHVPVGMQTEDRSWGSLKARFDAP